MYLPWRNLFLKTSDFAAMTFRWTANSCWSLLTSTASVNSRSFFILIRFSKNPSLKSEKSLTKIGEKFHLDSSVSSTRKTRRNFQPRERKPLHFSYFIFVCPRWRTSIQIPSHPLKHISIAICDSFREICNHNGVAESSTILLLTSF